MQTSLKVIGNVILR